MTDDSSTPAGMLPDPEIKAKLDQAAEIVTRHLDAAFAECVEEGLERDHISAAMMATLMQAMHTSLGDNMVPALQEAIGMAASKPPVDLQ